MSFFEEATRRLKERLGVDHDKEVAAALGLSPRAWAGRKQRGSFPEAELYALVAKRPELGVEVGYVLTGRSAPAKTPAATGPTAKPGRASTPNDRELALLSSFRAADEIGKAAIEATAALAAGRPHKIDS